MAGKDTSFTPNTVPTDTTTLINNFWQNTMEEIRNLNQNDFKAQELPLARIKKIMKLDDDVKMISAEAPVLFAKAAEIFISELSLRAWIHTEENKRRTLQRNDIAMAISKFDQFDFLIDIVPRDELKPTKRADEVQRTSMVPDQVQYFLQLAQQTQAALQQQQQTQTPTPAAAQPAAQATTQTVAATAATQPAAQAQTIQIQGQLPGGQIVQQATPQVQLQVQQEGNQGQPQIIQLQVPQQQQQAQQTTQVYHQIYTPSGEVQNIPIQLSADQLQALQLQIQGKQPGQPIIIQTAGNQSTEQISQQSQQMFQVQQVGGQQVFIQQSDDAQQSDTQES